MGLKITDTTLRDGHQSLWATRMRTKDMLPILEKLDAVGYHSLEVWGGATFDVCMRYLNEDPWERLRTLKKYIKRTPLQMLLRGQSLVGYQHYPDDVVEAFINKMVENGIDIIRIFDALNDLRNFEAPMRVASRTGAHIQAAVVYTISPVHTTEHYVETAVSLAQMGAHSICIKDMAGLLTPYKAYELVKLIKERVGLPVQLHSHYIGGLALGAYLKAAEAGVDVVDTASVPLAFGSSQPPVETVVRALQGTPYDTGLDLHLLFEIAAYFEDLRKSLGYERGVTRINDMRVFEHQVPGGMISNLVTQLEEQKALHRLPEVLEEIPRVRAELGYPPLVTPTSQIVGTQAVLNVLTGERYKLIPGEVRAYVEGHYGRPPAPVDPEVARKILGDKKPITCRPADLLEPKMDKIREEIKDLARLEEDFISYALFPQVARKYFENRNRSADPAVPVNGNQGPKAGRKEDGSMNLQEIKELIKLIDQTDIAELSLESAGVRVAIRKAGAQGIIPAPEKEAPPVPVQAREAAAPPAPEREKNVDISGLTVIRSPMVGTFYRAPAPDAPPFVQVGDQVTKGQILCIIEAMKLMNEIESEVSGEIVDILVENGQPVEYGQELFLIREK
ncbi:oxaloacetate decarboxylase, alpha subunit [Desulfofundulus australicus DSM 11792]|uniref:Oxaloacetate decarboxylase, alpha subunit n=1 Tax=Desulfofundulus australicus DSM 11792 TaxID=1121425 RepID=A0A1M5CU02_9FIRM|nr:acetyl-CoA carboxylase biotin carboxyl carrier protein [Desulfofundulus australicus]SHF58231.1 oxaloacetate decarboxylase, alpha subunit [Desulfofundulus australicus DSM 11792]